VRGLVVHQDARYTRNREYPKGLNNVLCMVWSCIKMHATHWKCSRTAINNMNHTK